eukprot:m51a1_g1955 hypothetical protein (655) ;mRNA; r:1022457-1026432
MLNAVRSIKDKIKGGKQASKETSSASGDEAKSSSSESIDELQGKKVKECNRDNNNNNNQEEYKKKTMACKRTREKSVQQDQIIKGLEAARALLKNKIATYKKEQLRVTNNLHKQHMLIATLKSQNKGLKEQLELLKSDPHGPAMPEDTEQRPAPRLSTGAVLRAALAEGRSRRQPWLASACERGPFVLQVLRSPSPCGPHALSDGLHYWCALAHGALVECDALLGPSPALRPLRRAPAAVVGRPTCAERCPEVARLAGPLGGSEWQFLGLQDVVDYAVPSDVLRLLRACVDWGSVRDAIGAAAAIPTFLCLLMSPDPRKRQMGLPSLYVSILNTGTIYTATVPAVKVMAEMLKLPEAAMDWWTRTDIMELFSFVLYWCAHWLSQGPFQGRAFEWEDLSAQEPEQVWKNSKDVVDALAQSVPLMCDVCCDPQVPIETRLQALQALHWVFNAMLQDETNREKIDAWDREASAVLLATDRKLGVSSPLALLDMATLQAIISLALSEWQALRATFRKAMLSLLSSTVGEPLVFLQASPGIYAEGKHKMPWLTGALASELLHALALDGLTAATWEYNERGRLCREWLQCKGLPGVVAAGNLCEMMGERAPDEAMQILRASLSEKGKPRKTLQYHFSRLSRPDEHPSYTGTGLVRAHQCY